MNKAKWALIGTLVLVGAATPLLLQQQALQLLRQQNRALAGQVAQAHEETEHLRQGLASAAADDERARQEHNELLRLRGEVTSLRRQVKQGTSVPLPAPVRAAPIVVPTPSSPAQPPGAFLPAESWADVGFGSPEAAVQTLNWALRTGDQDRMRQALLVPPGAVPDGAQRIGVGLLFDTATGAGGAVVSTGDSPPPAGATSVPLPELKGTRIIARSDVSAEEVTLTVENQHADGSTLQMPMNFKRVDGEWKLVPTYVESPPGSPAPVPAPAE